MAISFGNTWWGQQWLEALNRINYANRMSRGRTLANKGAVSAIKVTGNVIEARVMGGRTFPYGVSIAVTPYNEEEIEVFLRAIRNNPLVLAQLLNRELPQELVRIAEENGIVIFPSGWHNIRMHCTCRDWAIPCVHAAALLHIMANEIDKNPFLVFKLHNFDILEHLKSVELLAETRVEQPVLNLAAIVLDNRATPVYTRNEEAFHLIDFSTIPELGSQIVELYPSKALFFNGDFHALLAQYYRNKIRSFEKEPAPVEASAFATLRNSRIHIYIGQFGLAYIHYQYSYESLQTIDLATLCALLNGTSIKHIHNYSPYFSALYFIFHYCKRLIRQGAILPQLIESDRDTYRIRWTPALMNKNVKHIFDLLLDITPPDFSRNFWRGRNGHTSSRYLPAEENLKALCSMFLDFYFKSETSPLLHTGNESALSHNAKVAKLFFCAGQQVFDTFTEKEIPNSIQVWLNRFSIARKDVAPVLVIDEFSQHFECRVMVENNEHPLEPPVELHVFLSDANLPSKHLELMKDLAMLAEYMPELNDIIRTSGQAVVRFDNLTVVELLQKTLPALELFGIRVLLPKSLRQILKPQLSMKIKRKEQKSYFSMGDLLAFDWRVAFGDHLLTEEEFTALSNNAGRLIRIKDSYAMMTENEVKRVIKSLSTPRNVSSLNLLQSVLSEEYEGARVEIDSDVLREIRKLLQEEEVALPAGLQATLRPYQQRGFHWMYKNARLGFGSVLADDMGLGKTLQVITTLLKFKEEGRLKGHPALVVAPTTLLTNWEREIHRFAPGLTDVIYHGSGRKSSRQLASEADVVLTSYGIIRSETDAFKKTEWSTIVLDEAQNIKNNDTAQTRAVKQLKSKVKIAMSGTPVENRLSEYWSIFDFSNTGYLGNLSFFSEHFSKPIEMNRDRKKLENFRKITQPFILRREKSDKSIIDDLPDKIENNLYCTLSTEQVFLYKATVERNLQSVANTNGIQRQGLVLNLLNSLKQICNHPSQFLKKNDYSPTLSGKTEMLFHLLDNIYDAGEKALIFSQYAEMGTLLTEMIYERYGKRPLFLHGSCTLPQRDEMVCKFQTRPDADTFLLSLRAGGTGLNLTAATNVIHYDLWWNPAVESQATDRAFRIGQQKNVIVHRFITKNTLEEKIDAMIQDKKELAGLTVAKGEAWIGNMSDKDLQELVRLENE